jgi:Transcriptional regulator
MQYAKDEIRQRIMNVAREEFLAKGFEKASIRTITARAKTSKSNIYNYFNDKDQLFYSILEPTVAKINQGLELAKTFNVPKEAGAYTRESQKAVISAVVQFVSENLIDVKLLLFQSRGSSLENFKEKVIDIFGDILYGWTQSIRPDPGISKFFVRCIAIFYLNIIEQMILTLTDKEQAAKVGEEFLTFVYHGWQGIFQSKQLS